MSAAGAMAGLVLAGGRSSRLGRDKVLLRLQDGATLLARSVALLQRFCEPVLVSGRDPSQPDAEGRTPGVAAPWLPDAVSGIGPMGGIMAGLTELDSPLLVIACDLPLLDDATIARLLDFRSRRPAHALMTTFLQQETGFIESLVAVYEPGALAMLQASCEQGIYKLSRAVPREQRHELPYTPEEGHVFCNINRPQDLQALRHVFSERPGGDDTNAPEEEAQCF